MRGYSPKTARQIKWAAELHDIGKRHLPQKLLRKADKLTPAEFEKMKLHTIYGALILRAVPGEIGRVASAVAYLHHEKYDGQGYWGLRTSALPDFIGIVGICDVYCALRCQRAYKAPWTHDEALYYIEHQAGSQFCPCLANDFMAMTNKYTNWNDWLLTNICI